METVVKEAVKEKVTFAPHDPANYIDSKEAVIVYLEEALKDNDPDYLLKIVGYIARSEGMTQIAKELGLDRAGLYKSLASDGNPSFKTVFRLISLLGLQIRLERKSA